MKGSHPDAKSLRISPLEIPTVFPSRDARTSSRGVFAFSSRAFSLLPSLAGSDSFAPVIASMVANPTPPVLPHWSQNLWNPSGPRTDSIASSPSEERRNRYPCARKVKELSRS